MKIILLAFIAIISLPSLAQVSDSTKVFFRVPDEISAIRANNDHGTGLVICGNKNYGQEGLVFQVDQTGNVLWSKTILRDNTPYGTSLMDVIPTSDSAYIITGYSYDQALGSIVLCAKVDQNGDTLWTRNLRTDQVNTAAPLIVRVTESIDSSYIVTWQAAVTAECVVVKLDGDGNLVWEQIVQGFQLSPQTIKQGEDSTIYIGGNNNPDGGAILKLDIDGNVIWATNFADRIIHDLVYSDSAIYALYSSFGTFGVVGLDVDCNINWARNYSLYHMDSGEGDLPSLSEVNNGIIAIQTSGDLSGLAIMSTIDLDGNLQQTISYEMQLRDVIVHPMGGYYVLGGGPLFGVKEIWQRHIGLLTVDSLLATSYCYWEQANPWNAQESMNGLPLTWSIGSGVIISQDPVTYATYDIMDTNMCVSFLGAIDELNGLNLEVYPNQSSGQFTFGLEHTNDYTLDIYSIEGKLVYTKEFKGSEITIDISGQQEGFYIYSMRNSVSSSSGKILKN